MARLRGRARKGKRLKASAPFGKWGTQTFIAGLRHDGLTAPWVIPGAMDREAFNIYIETQLAPTLRPAPGRRAHRLAAIGGAPPLEREEKTSDERGGRGRRLILRRETSHPLLGRTAGEDGRGRCDLRQARRGRRSRVEADEHLRHRGARRRRVSRDSR